MRGIVGTAGHIDHGKTELIAALTGEHTDRLPEEQSRGISIDLGFTHLDTRHGVLGVIDVPGHEDFIRNMLAGATGIDVLLLVVAADEGVMPQTREHVAIARLLGVHRAVVALSKTDLVDDDWLGLVHDDIADFLADSPFAGAPIVPTSTVDGTGLDELRAAIEDVFEGTRGDPEDLFRLPVDRTFTVRGTGTVVTGTVWSGRAEEDVTVRLLPGEVTARIRGLQVHGADVPAVAAGQRAALALAGVDRDAINRGTTAVIGAGWAETSRITATLRVLPESSWSIEAWQRVRLHLGTAEVMARTVLLDRDRVEPGGHALVQLRLEAPVVARARDRFVVRSYSPVTTIGGGVVAEPLAPKRTRVDAAEGARLLDLAGDDDAATVAAVLAEAGEVGVRSERLPIVTGATPTAVDALLSATGAAEAGERVFEAAAARTVRGRVRDAVDRHHRAAPLQPGIDPEALRGQAAGEAGEAGEAAGALVEQELEGLLGKGELVMRRGAVARSGFTPTLTGEQEALKARVRDVIAEAGLAPPRLAELKDTVGSPGELEELVSLLVSDGALVRVEHDLFVDASAVEEAVARIRDRLGGRSDLSPGDFRDVLDVSRRHLIPLLEHFDRVGVTARGGSGRRVPD